jgi:hypothetical protein
LARLSKDLFVDAAKHRGLTGFGMERCWIRDMSNLTYSKCECISNFFSKLGSTGFRGECGFARNVGGMSGVVWWPSANTDAFLISCRDLKFGVGDKGIKGFIPPDEEPGVIDEFEGEVSLGCSVDSIGGFL